ncbi:MAG: hypothetical protein ACK4K0_05220 [Flavobacteriales bacterium]
MKKSVTSSPVFLNQNQKINFLTLTVVFSFLIMLGCKKHIHDGVLADNNQVALVDESNRAPECTCTIICGFGPCHAKCPVVNGICTAVCTCPTTFLV